TGDEEISTMPLIGLIGAEGVVGIFNSEGGSSQIAGGFTARPFALTPAGIAAATPPTDIFVSVLQDYATLPTTGSATSGGFVKLGNTFTNTDVATFAPTGFASNDSTITIRNDIEFDGGFAYFSITDDDSETKFYYYAGILADTDLGRPRTDTAGAVSWTGQFSEHASRLSADTDDFIKFHIDFGAGRLQFRNTADNGGNGTLTRGIYTYTLNARFGNGFADVNNNIITTGQLGGQVRRSTGLQNDPDKFAPISGLIGEKGVIGAFVDTTDRSHFAGGFWAVETIGEAPDGDSSVVNFADWSDGFGREHTLPSRADPSKSQFLEGLATVTGGKGLDETGVNVSHRFALTFDNDSASYKGSPLGGNGTAADGVVGIRGGNDNRYVGLLSGTNLGAPIRSPSHVGMWRGQFVGYGRRGTFPYGRTSDDVVLAVTYDTANRNGTIKIVNPSCRTASKSCINSSQFTSRYYEMVGGKYNDRGVISGEIRYYYTSNNRQGYVP
ncbi:MAG: hypothetical protein K8953_09660, partial [Proteobacteria bacterium]|nr:hypothetical protein [Pseudomonadota bacterium]